MASSMTKNWLKAMCAGPGIVYREIKAALEGTFTTIVRTGYTTQIGTRAKVGGSAGWVVAAATDLPYVATMAASASLEERGPTSRSRIGSAPTPTRARLMRTIFRAAWRYATGRAWRHSNRGIGGADDEGPNWRS